MSLTRSIGILIRECRAEIRKAARMPSFAFPTLVLPVAFYALFGLALARGEDVPRYMLATFGVCTGQPGFNALADFNASGCVDLSDLAALLANFGM